MNISIVDDSLLRSISARDWSVVNKMTRWTPSVYETHMIFLLTFSAFLVGSKAAELKGLAGETASIESDEEDDVVLFKRFIFSARIQINQNIL